VGGGRGVQLHLLKKIAFFEEKILLSFTRLKSNLDDVTFLHLIFEIRHDF